LPVRGAVHGPVLAVRDTGDLPVHDDTGELALAALVEPDGRPDRRLPGRLSGSPAGLAADQHLAHDRDAPLPDRGSLLPPDGAPLRGHHMKAIRVQKLSKRYQIGASQSVFRYRTFREAILEAAAAPVRRLRRLRGSVPEAETIWALRDVDLEVQAGEVL